MTAIVGYALGSGRRTALASVAGIAPGDGVAMISSLTGAGVLLAASALAFGLLKAAGGAVSGWDGDTRAVQGGTGRARRRQPKRGFAARGVPWQFRRRGAASQDNRVYVAFVPQFIDAHENYAAQAALLTATFCGVVAASDTAWALAASFARAFFLLPCAALWSKRASGATPIAAGVATAAARR